MRWGGRLSQNLAELSMKKEEMKTDLSDLQVQAERDFAPVSGGSQVPWGLGRLFGASKSPNSPQGHTPPTRLADSLTVISESLAGEKADGYPRWLPEFLLCPSVQHKLFFPFLST